MIEMFYLLQSAFGLHHHALNSINYNNSAVGKTKGSCLYINQLINNC